MKNFIVNNEFITVADPKDQRMIANQYAELTENRMAAESAGFGTMTTLAHKAGFVAANAGQKAINEQVDLMYREVDNDPIIERNPTGFQSTLMTLLGSAQPVNIGKKEVKKRRVGEAGKAGISMSGQTGIVLDHTLSDYQSAVVPIFDGGYGLDWRDRAAAQSEGWDQTVDDSREVEKTVYSKVDDFLWNGDSSIVGPDGTVWNGLKGIQQGISSYTLTVDLTTATGEQVTNEMLALINVLRINNDCDGPFNLVLSREIFSAWRLYGSAQDQRYGTIIEMVRALFPEFVAITEDPKLSGNQVFLAVMSREGLHAKSGMAMSTYALPRFKHNDSFDFIKWCAFGFMAAETKGGKDCAVYGS